MYNLYLIPKHEARGNLNILLSCFSFQSQAAAINNHENAGYCLTMKIIKWHYVFWSHSVFFSHVLHYPQNDCNRNLSNLYPSNNYLNLWLSFYLKGLTRAFWRSYTLPPERIVIRFICNVFHVIVLDDFFLIFMDPQIAVHYQHIFNDRWSLFWRLLAHVIHFFKGCLEALNYIINL